MMKLITIGLFLFGSVLILSGTLLALQRRTPSAAYFLLIADGNSAPQRYYTVLPDGTGKRLIYTAQYYVRQAIWKPDGKALLAAWDTPGLYEINARNGQRRLVDDHALIEDNLVLSPDRRSLASVVVDGAYHHLYLTRADGTQGRILTPGLREYVKARSVSWSADGQWIYFSWCRDRLCNYHKVHHQGGEIITLAEDIKGQDLSFCGMSPGGTWLVLCEWQTQTRYFISPSQQVVQQVAMMPYFWSPDDQWIYYQTEPHQLLRSYPDGTHEEIALEIESGCVFLFFRDDWLYCTSTETTPDFYRMRLDGRQTQQIAEGTLVGYPSLLDEGNMIIGLEDTDGSINFYRVAIDGRERQWLIKTPPLAYYGLTPYENQLYYAVDDPSGNYRIRDYYLVDIDSGKQHRVPTQGTDSYIYSFSPIISFSYQSWMPLSAGVTLLGAGFIGYWQLRQRL